MEQLAEIARLRGKSAEQMLKEELSVLSSSTVSSQGCHDPSLKQNPQTEPYVRDVSSPPVPLVLRSSADETVMTKTQKNLTDPSALSASKNLDGGTTQPLIDINPPSVQRMVVEHVVRNSEGLIQSTTPGQLHAFSGKSLRPNNEVDYDTWRSSVEVLIKDPSVSDLHCAHRILDSLLPPASEMIKHLGPLASPSMYLELLDSTDGTVEDGDELYARFMNTLQKEGEKLSAFLQSLHVALSVTVRRGGVSSHNFDQHLLKQFCRDCWESALIVDLQLEQRKESPPSFSELLLMLRTQEDKQASKMSCMKQHFGFVKPDHNASKPCEFAPQGLAACGATELVHNPEIETLKKQVADLSAHISGMTIEGRSQKPKKQKAKSLASNVNVEAQIWKKNLASPSYPTVKATTKPRPRYCFQCGEDGHVASACENPPNSSLVAEKKETTEREAGCLECSGAKTTFKLMTTPIEGHMGVKMAISSPNSEKPVLKNAKVRGAQIPKGLVGAKTTAQVSISGKPTSCLLDTGSQGTTVPQSFYQQHITDRAMISLRLRVQMAN